MAAYHRPESLDDALGILAESPVSVAAGCTDLFPATEARALIGPILDITAIRELRGVTAENGRVRIGAAATWTDIVAADLPPAFDMLKEAAREVGSVQIQNAGTVAGNLCNASPAADGVPCLLALDAQVELASATQRRVLPLNEFITGPRRTALRPGELVTAITVPEMAARGRSRFLKLGARRYLVISIAMVAARLHVVEGRVAAASVAVGACGPVAVRLHALEKAIGGRPPDAGLAALATRNLVGPVLSPIADIRADAAYRVEAAVALVRRALDDLTAKTEAAA